MASRLMASAIDWPTMWRSLSQSMSMATGSQCDNDVEFLAKLFKLPKISVIWRPRRFFTHEILLKCRDTSSNQRQRHRSLINNMKTRQTHEKHLQNSVLTVQFSQRHVRLQTLIGQDNMGSFVISFSQKQRHQLIELGPKHTAAH